MFISYATKKGVEYLILIKRFLLMIQFLTRIPVPAILDSRNEDYGKGLVFAPMVGFIIGGIIAGLHLILKIIFPIYIAAIFDVLAYIILTGGIHIDGLGDTFDGLFSNSSKERILEIMRDSRTGTNAVLSITALMIVDTAFIAALGSMNMNKVLVMMPAAGRVGSLISSGISTYARKGEGLGKSFVDYCGIKEVIMGLALFFAGSYLIAGATGLFAAIFPVLSAFLLTKFFSSKIGGVTGDILGAVCELNQVIFLIAAYVIFRA